MLDAHHALFGAHCAWDALACEKAKHAHPSINVHCMALICRRYAELDKASGYRAMHKSKQAEVRAC